jgi:hypothetical protein
MNSLEKETQVAEPPVFPNIVPIRVREEIAGWSSSRLGAAAGSRLATS